MEWLTALAPRIYSPEAGLAYRATRYSFEVPITAIIGSYVLR